MTIDLSQISLPPGGSVHFERVDWPSYEKILAQYETRPGIRIAYHEGRLEFMTPSMTHETDKGLLGALIEALLEASDREFINAGSTTFKHQGMAKGVEPDQCFYIAHEAAVRGKRTIDLTIDPPPDLALEIDITTRRQHLALYAALAVPEFWRFDGEHLDIYVLRNGRYEASMRGDHFPDLPLAEVLPRFIQQSRQQGRNVAMRAFRQWLGEQL